VPASLDITLDSRDVSDSKAALVELCRPRLYPVAMLIKQVLEQNGVPVAVPGANAFSVMPHLAFSGELRVMVGSDDLDYARQLYSAYFECDDDAQYGAVCDVDAQYDPDAQYNVECDGGDESGREGDGETQSDVDFGPEI
jgi:hypothetical protein